MPAHLLNQVLEPISLILFPNTASTQTVEPRSKLAKSKVTQTKKRMTSLLKPKNCLI